MKKKKKFNFKKGGASRVLIIVLAALLTLGAFAGVFQLGKVAGKETKTISPTFKVGSLDATGKYEKSDGSIYTKKMFKCKGLAVELTEDANVTYEVFYYDTDEKFVTSEIYTDSAELTVPDSAVYARLVVTPIWDASVKAADRVIKWYNVSKYSKQLKITVLKDQTVNEEAEYLEVTLNLKEGAFYHSTSLLPSVVSSTADNSKYFFCTQTFTKETLPNGSYIEIADGWQYRLEGWTDENTLSSTRGDVVTTAKVVVDNEWWGDYTIRGFNISKEGNVESLIGKEAEVRKAFKIYVPNPNYKAK